MAIRLFTRNNIESLAQRLFFHAEQPSFASRDILAARRDIEDAAVVLGVLVAMGFPCHAIVIDAYDETELVN